MQEIKSTAATTRFSWVDIAKGIATLLVVYRHVLYGIGRTGIYINDILWNLNEMVYSFRMPLFFILSGFFFARSLKKRSLNQFVKNKARLLLYPYFFWALLQVSLQVVLKQYTNSNRDWYDYVQIIIQPRAIDQLWFLYSLFNVTAVYLFLKYVVKLPFKVLFVLSIISLYGSTLVDQYSPIHDLFYFMIFFLAGDYFSDRILQEKTQKVIGSNKWILLLFPIFALSQWFWLNHPDMNIYLFSAVAVFGSFYTIAVSIRIMPYKISKFFELIGKNSLQIYVMHVIISSAFRIFTNKILGVNNLYVLLIVGLTSGILIPLLVVRASKRFPILNWLFNPPPEKKKE